MNETMLPVFQEGDRVIGIAEYDGNSEIVGMTGTIRSVEGDVYGVEFDDDIGGHSLSGSVEYGRGWFTGAIALAPYQDEPAEIAYSMSYDEVMI